MGQKEQGPQKGYGQSRRHPDGNPEIEKEPHDDKDEKKSLPAVSEQEHEPVPDNG